MKIEITILGLLMEQNLYGYEIKKRIVDRLEDFVDIKFGSIYYAIKKAMENGWVTRVGSEKDSGNPERYIYEILPAGKKHYKKMIKSYFESNNIHFDIDIVLMFMSCLTREFLHQFKVEREEEVRSKLSALKEKISSEKKSADDSKCSTIPILTYLEKHLQAELQWLTELKPEEITENQEDPL